jgi:hypothetical protein
MAGSILGFRTAFAESPSFNEVAEDEGGEKRSGGENRRELEFIAQAPMRQ